MIWIQKRGPFLLINDLWPAKPSVELQMLSKTFFLLNLDINGINTLTYIITQLKSKFCYSSQNLLNFANQNNSSATFFSNHKHRSIWSFSVSHNFLTKCKGLSQSVYYTYVSSWGDNFDKWSEEKSSPTALLKYENKQTNGKA